SMKMEISIAAPRDGSVAEVLVAPGDQVDRGATLIELAEEEPSASTRREGELMQTVSHESVTDKKGDA
ncbi:MAG TPA: biotin/lipoyl-containing protein, partial [Solirubrobacterales bacterium]|nr:biotin/lipoyl-containing protein [Solirubrobacterales bacterium]